MNKYFYLTALILIIILINTNTVYNIKNNDSFIIINNEHINEFKQIIDFTPFNIENASHIRIFACNKISVKEGDEIKCIAYFNNNNATNANYQIIFNLLNENETLIKPFHEFNLKFINDSKGYINSRGVTPLANDSDKVQLWANAGDTEGLNALAVNIKINNYTENGVLILVNKPELYTKNVSNQKEIKTPYSFGKKPIKSGSQSFCIITDNQNLCVNTSINQNLIVWILSINSTQMELIYFVLIFSIIFYFNKLKKIKDLPIICAIILSLVVTLMVLTNKNDTDLLFNFIFYIMISQIIISVLNEIASKKLKHIKKLKK